MSLGAFAQTVDNLHPSSQRNQNLHNLYHQPSSSQQNTGTSYRATKNSNNWNSKMTHRLHGLTQPPSSFSSTLPQSSSSTERPSIAPQVHPKVHVSVLPSSHLCFNSQFFLHRRRDEGVGACIYGNGDVGEL
ncbi:unnamed protein product [Lactuca saligna]|uniref:Uncharacterized protein n=1 Tax=Lactuca saligna TaxID=75948 RepID=A0AA35Z028_LACSI|nr:unnamed protein product [Lactuca saligna]